MNSLQTWFENFPIEHFKKGEILLHQDMVPAAAYILKHGIVKTSNVSLTGQEKPISFILKGDIFPIGWVFHKIRTSPYFYTAFTDGEMYRIPRQDFLDYLKDNPEAVYHVLSRCVDDLLSQEMHVDALEQSTATQKVIQALHFLASRFGRRVEPDLVEIALPLTQQDLASFAGLARETINAELKTLIAREVVFHKRQSYSVNMSRLIALLDSGYEY